MQSSQSKMAYDYDLIATAYHESSHVICGLFNYIKPDNIELVLNKVQKGTMWYECQTVSKIEIESVARTCVIFEVQTLYAGLIGEKIYYREICGSDKFPMYLRIGSSGDTKAASKLITAHDVVPPNKTKSVFKKELQSETYNILMRYWEDVRLISHQLYKKKHLSFKDVKKLLLSKSENKEFWKRRFKHLKTIYDGKKDIEDSRLLEIFVQEFKSKL